MNGATLESLLTESSADEELAGAFAALAHPARLAILRYLAGNGACCCKEVVDQLDLAQSTVSQHLKVLVTSGLVRFSPERQRSRYCIDAAALARLSRRVDILLAACQPRCCG